MITKAFPSEPYPSFFPTFREAPGGGPSIQVSELIVGPTGAPMSAVLSASADWTPGTIASQASASKVVAVAGAAVGDVVSVGVSPALPAGLVASGQATGDGEVTVVIGNLSGSSATLAAGSVRVAVAKF